MGDVKVYLDYNIWIYIQNDKGTREFFLQEMREHGWKYYISAAHLEELYNNEMTAPEDKKNVVKELQAFMKENSEDGVIKPGSDGLILECYNIVDRSIRKCDTREDVKKIAGIGFEARNNNGLKPIELFKGHKSSGNEDYKEVWETQTVKNLLSNVCCGNMDTYASMKHKYIELERSMALLYGVLSAAGFRREKKEEKYNSAEYDIQHSICATYCDVFVTADKKFAEKYKAVAYK